MTKRPTEAARSTRRAETRDATARGTAAAGDGRGAHERPWEKTAEELRPAATQRRGEEGRKGKETRTTTAAEEAEEAERRRDEWREMSGDEQRPQPAERKATERAEERRTRKVGRTERQPETECADGAGTAGGERSATEARAADEPTERRTTVRHCYTDCYGCNRATSLAARKWRATSLVLC